MQVMGKVPSVDGIKSRLTGRLTGVVLSVVVLLGLVISVPQTFENLDASEFMVIQSPFSGDLDVYTTPGVKYQGFGKVTKYPRQAQYSFCSATDHASKQEVLCQAANAPSKKLRFNDGGHANLNGFVMWEMPHDAKSITEIHQRFGSAEAVQIRAVAKMIDGAVYLAGPLMSSTESSGSRRGELVNYINDQAENGIYVTKAENITTKDPITQQEKTEAITKIVMGANGVPARQQGSVLSELNIKLQPLSISDLQYDNIVEAQIKQRQEATTAVQISVANALRAEQDAKTAAKQGEAKAATAKWEQEVIKAKEVTRAQQQLEVATLAAKEAEQYKKEQILRGEGDAQAKALRMNADGALDAKLEAYKEVNAKYAEAIQHAQPGAWTPSVVMGSSGGQNGSGAQSLIDMFAAKTAKELGVDMSVAGKAATSKK